MRIPTIFVMFAYASLGQAGAAQPAGTTCHVATYQFDDGNFVDVAPAGAAAMAAATIKKGVRRRSMRGTVHRAG